MLSDQFYSKWQDYAQLITASCKTVKTIYDWNRWHWVSYYSRYIVHFELQEELKKKTLEESIPAVLTLLEKVADGEYFVGDKVSRVF